MNPPVMQETWGDVGSIPWRREEGGGDSNPLQYSCLEKPMDRGAWWARVHGIAKSWTRMKGLSTHAKKYFQTSHPGAREGPGFFGGTQLGRKSQTARRAQRQDTLFRVQKQERFPRERGVRSAQAPLQGRVGKPQECSTSNFLNLRK